jgi:hypothetical protein
MGRIIPNSLWKNKFMFQTTNQLNILFGPGPEKKKLPSLTRVRVPPLVRQGPAAAGEGLWHLWGGEMVDLVIQ